MIDLDAGETPGSEDDLNPNPAVLLGGVAAIALVSSLSLPWPVAIASTVLGALMVAGADIDAGCRGSRCARRLRRRCAGLVSQQLCLAQAERGTGSGRCQAGGGDRGMAAGRSDTIMFRPCNDQRAADGDICALSRSIHDADDEDPVRRIFVPCVMDRIFCGPRVAIVGRGMRCRDIAD